MEISEIKQKAVKGFAWVSVYTAGARLVQFIAGLILADLLDPEHFGAYALGRILVVGLVMFREMGFTPALVQIQDEVERAFRSSTLAIPIFGSVVFLVIYLIAPLFAKLVSDESVVTIVRMMGLVAPISSLGVVPAVYLQRNLLFQRKVIPEVVSVVVANLTAVIIAVKGGGVWSLVSALLITELLRSVLFWVCAGLKFQPVIDFKMWKRLLRFGYNVSLGSVMGFLYGLMDQFAIGKYLGKVQLGFYSLSMTLGTALSTNIIALSNQVILATLSSLQDTEESYFRSYRRGLSIFALIAVPYAVGVFLFGGELLRALYGNKWDGAIIALKILSFYGLAKSLGEINGEVFFSKGKPKYFKYQGTGRVIICLLLLPLVIKYGKMETVALLFTAILSAFVLLTFHWAAKLMKKRLWDILLTFKSHLFAIVGGVILLWLGNLLLEGLAYRIILFYIGYSLVILTLAKDDLQIIWEFIMSLREKDKTSGGNL